MNLDLLRSVHVFPIRHHSPRSSAALRAFLEHTRPSLVLVEGPHDATHLLAALVDPGTKPPVAILGYRVDGEQGSSLWPFATYSPEYVAVKWAAERGARAEFIDIAIGTALAPHEGEVVGHEDLDDPGSEESWAPEHEADEPAAAVAQVQEEEEEAPRVNVYQACAEARGFRSFEEFWEASFEAPAYDPSSFREALIAYADLVRAEGDRLVHRARDAFMARQVLERIEQGIAPERIAVVVGAAHAAAFAAGDVDLSLDECLPAPVPVAATLIPYSFPRLAEQLGYGAGNRAPRYYQRAHDAGCDFQRATLEVLVEFTEHLRLRGFMASLADTIEAYRLAVRLADIRGKAGPGLDEVREATIATLCRGDAAHVDGFLWPAMIGKSVGHVASRIGRTSLQEEFWREVRARRLPASDAPESFTLQLTNETEVGTSIFLHRLRIGEVPYPTYLGTQRGLGGRAARAKQDAALDTQAFLSQVNEAWEAQWTPATDVALVEKIVLGDTLEQVVTRALGERLANAGGAGDAADVLLDAVLTSCPVTVSAALRACDRLAAYDDDLPSLARTTSNVSYLVSFGSTRSRSSVGDQVLVPLARKSFDRAVLRVRQACTGDDEAVAPIKGALRTLHDLATSRPYLDQQAWAEAARDIAETFTVNPACSGMCCGLLYLAQKLDEDEVSRIVGLRLGAIGEPLAAASFLDGFLEVNALVMVKSRPVVEALDAFLAGIAPERFRETLPVLRRAFSRLGTTERRYLLENVLVARRIADRAEAAHIVLLEQDRERLVAMSDELSAAMDDLDELL
ncbi:DUF5682 family protein [Chondromyces apiculatus]|uniref:Uncharacterized protein n=1 Tax=Chondromyces apiculatus DSM 436 TaxID=1192034 RepID=A0A017TBB3_9BACT|nr:DUF5682 family protein [Chondromyces apiculatus]EYF06212.1 Hypothetical protein CAP_2090 [Chondromyces apiculatus DSM 436]